MAAILRHDFSFDYVIGYSSRDLPLIYLYHQTWIWALGSDINGYTPYPDGMIRLAEKSLTVGER